MGEPRQSIEFASAAARPQAADLVEKLLPNNDLSPEQRSQLIDNVAEGMSGGLLGADLGGYVSASVGDRTSGSVSIVRNKNDSENSTATENSNLMAGYKYFPTPKNIEGVPELKRVKSKTSVQGGGKLQARWIDPKGNTYEWDSAHGALEKYNKNGKPLGKFDPKSGKKKTS